MASSVPPSNRSPLELKGQAKVIYEVKRLVDHWRGFELGAAQEAYPDVEPHYQPTHEAERPITETSLALLRHWFRCEPHVLESSSGSSLFRYWPHQRRLVETFVYLYEVRGIRRTEQLYQRNRSAQGLGWSLTSGRRRARDGTIVDGSTPTGVS